MIILTSFFNIPIKEILRHHHFRKEKDDQFDQFFFLNGSYLIHITDILINTDIIIIYWIP